MKYLKLNLKDCHNQELLLVNYECIKQELKRNDFITLFGALALAVGYNEEFISDFTILNDVIEHASISNNELYLNDFEGYQLSDRLILRTLYINQYEHVVFSIYDIKKDRYLDFV